MLEKVQKMNRISIFFRVRIVGHIAENTMPKINQCREEIYFAHSTQCSKLKKNCAIYDKFHYQILDF